MSHPASGRPPASTTPGSPPSTYGLARHRPRHRHRLPRRPVGPGHGPPARGRRHGPHHHVPRHRLHRGPRPDRLRASSSSRAEASVHVRIRTAAGAALRSLAASSVCFAAPAGAQEEASDEESPELDHASPRSASTMPRGRRTDRRLPGGAQPDPARAPTRSSGARIGFLVVFVFLPGSSACPPMSKGMDARTERIRGDLEAAETSQGRGRGGARRVPGPARRRQGRGRPHHRGGPPGRRRDQARPGGPRSRPSWPSCAPGPSPTSRPPRPRPWPTCGARSPRWPSAPPRPSCSATSTRRPRPSSSRTTSTRWRRPSARTARRSRRWQTTARWPTPRPSSAWPGPRAPSARSRTSCSASPGPSGLRRAARRRSPTRASRRARRQQIVEDLLGGKASPTTVGPGVDGGRHRPGPRAARPSSASWSR